MTSQGEKTVISIIDECSVVTFSWPWRTTRSRYTSSKKTNTKHAFNLHWYRGDCRTWYWFTILDGLLWWFTFRAANEWRVFALEIALEREREREKKSKNFRRCQKLVTTWLKSASSVIFMLAAWVHTWFVRVFKLRWCVSIQISSGFRGKSSWFLSTPYRPQMHQTHKFSRLLSSQSGKRCDCLYLLNFAWWEIVVCLFAVMIFIFTRLAYWLTRQDDVCVCHTRHSQSSDRPPRASPPLEKSHLFSYYSLAYH